jgi:hypothetical protein
MFRHFSSALAALTLVLAAAPTQAAPSNMDAPADTAPSVFVDYFFRWKSQPEHFQVSELKILKAGDSRVLCGAYALPGQARRPFLVLGDATPQASAAWEPGSFPESDPLYPQLMDNLRLCQTLGAVVTASMMGRAG